MAKNGKSVEGKSLAATIKALNDKNPGSVIRLGDHPQVPVEVIPTGIATLDLALGVGGLPRGKIVELFGHESSGKTTIALSTIAQVQSRGERAVLIDVEHSFDPSWARRLGVNVEELLLSQPPTAEDALQTAITLVETGEIALVVIDSVAALAPKAELDGEMGDALVGLIPRLMNQAMRKIVGPAELNNCCVLFINQIREKVGVMYGSPETTPGGRGLKFFASVRLKVRAAAGDRLKVNKTVVGSNIIVDVVKNKVAAPFRVASFDLMFESGIDRVGCLVDTAIAANVLDHNKHYYYWNGSQVAAGRDKLVEYVRETPEYREEVERRLREVATV